MVLASARTAPLLRSPVCLVLQICVRLCVVLAIAPQWLHAQRQSLVPLAEMNHSAGTYADSLMLGGATRIIESNDGYLWFSSAQGLTRFDGVRFTVVDSTFTPALRTNRRGSFQPRLVDRDGALWISRPDGALVTYRNGRFAVRTRPEPGRSPRVTEDAAGVVYVWTGGQPGLRRLSADGQFADVPLPWGTRVRLQGVIRDNGDGVWVGTLPGGLWHRSHGAWSSVTLPGSASVGAANPLLQARDGTLWVTIEGALFQLRGDQWTKVSLPTAPGVPLFVRQVVEDRTGSLWMPAIDHGVLRWSNGTVEAFSLSEGLSGADALSVSVNAAGVVWVSTGAGLDRLRVSALVPLVADGIKPVFPLVRLVQDVSGFAWAQGEGGRSLLQLHGGSIDGTGRPLSSTPVPIPDVLKAGFEILEASRVAGVWVTPHSGGLGRVTSHGFEASGIRMGVPPERILRLLEAHDSSLWLATLWGGLGRVYNGRYSAIALPGLTKPRIAAFAEDAAGHVWISSDDSPNVFEFSGEQLVRQFNAGTGLRDTILRLVCDRGDTVWGVGTSSIVRFAGARASTIRLPAIAFIRGSTDRLRTQGVPSLGAFIAGEALWVAGEGGISQLSLRQLRKAAGDSSQTVDAEILTASDGALAPVARALTLEPVTRTNNGRFWIRTPTGFATLDPSRLADVHPQPHPIIEEVSVAGHRLPIDSLVLGPNAERVEIRVSATSDVFPERARLQHRLDGVEHEWTRTGASRVVTYTQLRPGHYTFRLRARTAGDTTVGNESTIAFDVVPAWYQSAWFTALILLTMGIGVPLVVYSIARYRSGAREAQMRARFDAALEERTRVARELHDTLLQGFSGIALQLQVVLLSTARAPDDTAKRLARILSLVDATLLDARRSIWDMRMPELESQDLATAIEASAQGAVLNSPIVVQVKVRGRSRRLAPALESTALRIGREALSNAVRHGNPRSIEIELDYGEATVGLMIRDDGKGLDLASVQNASRSGHWGISGMRERAESVGGSFEMRGAAGAGTTVSLMLPTAPDAGAPSVRAGNAK